MGGYGSGRWYRYATKRTTSGLNILDVNWLNRNGNLAPGRWSSIGWSRGGEPAGSIGIRAEEGLLVLDYKWHGRDNDWETVTESVLLSWTPCNYGGQRPWFICPGVINGFPCRRRVARLYAAGKYFLCRHCYNLVYESQREALRFRLLYKAQGIRRRLGGSADMGEPFPWKPKGMHWKTYERLRRKAEHAELRSDGMLGEWMLARFGVS